VSDSTFEWDETKNDENIFKHGVSFYEAQYAFFDKNRIIAEDIAHSLTEKRYYCFGYDQNKIGIITVRFTYRKSRIRIFGAAYWRRGKKVYEKTNKI